MQKWRYEHNAVNLSQGYPNFETDQRLKELVTKAMNDGYNQYAPLAGISPLREQIVDKIETLHGKKYDKNTEVTVTNGATQALFLAITAFVNPGDEVIVLKPAYDCYEPAIKLNGGIPVLLQLKGKEYKIDWEEVEEKINSKNAECLIINTPHNPSGNVFSKEDMLKLEQILEGTDVILLSDEVYEHIVFDDAKHYSASAFPNLCKKGNCVCLFWKDLSQYRLENGILCSS